MKETLESGRRCEHRFTVPTSKTVPKLHPASEEFLAMPEVFATGYLVGLFEWACIRAINPHLDWPHEQTVGTHTDVSHEAATPAGLEVVAKVELIAVEGKRLVFQVEAHDGVDLISKDRHERFVIDKARFDAQMLAKGNGAWRKRRQCETARRPNLTWECSCEPATGTERSIPKPSRRHVAGLARSSTATFTSVRVRNPSCS